MSKYVEIGTEILRTLQQRGYDAYFVGGFVRDHLLGIESDDIDITTSATPSEVLRIFPHVKETGRKFGGVTILMDAYKYEVTTFRLEGEYTQHRYPKAVSFSARVQDDIARRDFTINALLMNADKEVIDYVNGKHDLALQQIRAIGVPKRRFEEDALRLLRAFRFVAKLGFTIEQKTLEAIQTNGHLIQRIAIERVMQELQKIIIAPHYQQAFLMMAKTKIHQSLYGLSAGISLLSTCNKAITPVEFYAISFIVGTSNDIWRFSNKDARLIEQVVHLHHVTKDDHFNRFLVFSYKLKPCLITNKINVILGYNNHEQTIKDMWENMPIHDVCDLAFKGQDILTLTTLKKRSDIGLVIDDLLFNVIMGIMPNEYEVLKDVAVKKINKLQNEVGEDYE